MKTKVVLIVLCLGLFGCMSWTRSKHTQATSIVDFLYPKESNHIDVPGMAVLSLPLRVGIVMLPPMGKGEYYAHSGPTEVQKTALLQKVAAEFRALPYVKSIEVIPSAYLRPNGSFANLDQLKTMYGVDVITLVSYDQVQFTDQNFLSIAYWTVVGLYVVQAEKNDTQTMIDAVVYDVASRRMLFRAPGLSRVKAHAAPISLSDALREDSAKGLELATMQMIANLQTELTSFKERIKDRPEDFKVEHKAGYTGGGGSFDGWFAGTLAVGLAMAAARRWRKAGV